MATRSIRLCAQCGAPLPPDTPRGTKLCDACRLKARQASVVRMRTCQDCGGSFRGGPRAMYCPQCRHERALESSRRSRKRGTLRPLGSTDQCVVCGADYIVESGRQRYCKACAEAAVKSAVRPHKAEYMRSDPDRARAWKDGLRGTRQICVWCGKEFIAHTPTNVCSPACAEARRKKRQADADKKRRPAKKTD